MEKIRVRGRHYITVLIVSLIFMISLMTAIKPAKAAYVKFYVDQPLGYIPFQTPGVGQAVVIPIKIETSGIPDYVAGGIAGWGLNLRVDPNVLDINTTGCAPPTCIPPIPANATAVQGNFMPTYASWYGISTLWGAGSADPLTGYWANIADALNPNPGHGAGDGFIGMGYDLLVTIQVTSKVNQPCLIDIVSGYYKLGDASVHAADILVDGYYGQPPPRIMSYAAPGSVLPPGPPPVPSQWHELWPKYCEMWTLVGWTDNGDVDFTASDQIDMVNGSGWTYHFHVDKVLVTIHWTFKPDGTTPDGYEAGCEPYQPIEVGTDSESGEPEIIDPVGTTWHEIYPEYCREFVITSHADTDEDGNLDPSEQFDFEYFGEGVIHWAHLDDITTDIILSQKGEPEPPTPEFPLGVAVEVGLMVAVVYIWWTRRRRLKEVP